MTYRGQLMVCLPLSVIIRPIQLVSIGIIGLCQEYTEWQLRELLLLLLLLLLFLVSEALFNYNKYNNYIFLYIYQLLLPFKQYL